MSLLLIASNYFPQSSSFMAAKEVKANNETKSEDYNSPKSLAVNRLSHLPLDMIYHILSFVPTLQVVRMSLLSRFWRHTWCSVSALYFCESNSLGLNFSRTKFRRFIDKCLNHHGNSNLAVTKFKLDIKYHPDVVEWLLSSICYSNLKELDLCIRTTLPGFFYLPPCTLSLRSCTTVKLTNVALNHLGCTNLPHLKSLSLEHVKLDDQILHNLLIGCSSLEKLTLKDCANLFRPKVSSSSLKFLDIVHGSYQTMFEIASTSLQCFVFDGGLSYCKISLSCFCQELLHLSLSNTGLHEQCLADIISRLPHIESLSLCNTKIPHIEFWSDSLKHLFLKESRNYNVLQTRIATPNLVSFSFDGDFLPNFSLFAPNISQAVSQSYLQ